MISGKVKELKSITPKDVLSFVSEYDIFRYYMPEKYWTLNKATHSPFRKDNNPSFTIYQKDFKMFFIDFSDSYYRGDCFQFVQMLFNVSYNDALLMIDKDFNLGISTQKNESLPDYKKITSDYQQPDVLEKRYSHIQVITRKFTVDELEYWNQYHQDIEDLRKNNIYAVKKLYLNRRQISINKNELNFGYFYDGHWKIYRPHNKDFKWIPNNVPITTMDGKENINGCDTAFINKSKKDYMVIRKIYPHTCAVQNEGIGCFMDEENVKFLKENSHRQVLSFDSDVPGVKNSKVITDLFGFEYCNVPRYYLQEGIKDWADLAKKYGLQIIEHYLKQKFIIP
jgi:hypothetical protein